MSADGTGIKTNVKRIDCGMLYVIKLADENLVIIDGAGYQQFDDAQIEQTYSFLKEISNYSKTGKIDIACWYITHGHSDHFSGMFRMFSKYHISFNVERIVASFPSVNESVFSSAKSNIKKLFNYMTNYFGSDISFLKAHTGQKFNIADIQIEILYTHEDIVNGTTGKTEVTSDYNDSSLVCMITFDGKRFLCTGDINQPPQAIILEMYSKVTLKSDIAQVAHHAINDLSDLYNVVQAPIVLYPQSPKGATRYAARVAMKEVLLKYASSGNLYYASANTYGFSVVNGVLKLVDTRSVAGGDYGDWSW